MKEITHDDRPSAARPLYSMLLHGLPLEGETALFILASTLDMVMTWYLIYHRTTDSPIFFVESNPIPRYFLYSWGFDGLVYFKFFLVGLVSLICQIIARRRIDIARRVLLFATVIVMGVVIYSVVLMVQHT